MTELETKLLAALKAAHPFIVTQSICCKGDKCGEPWCYSCNGEEDAEAAAQEGANAFAQAGEAILAAEATTQPDADGWIKWDGKECPLERGVLVDVRYRDGQESLRLPVKIDLDECIRDAGFVSENG